MKGVIKNTPILGYFAKIIYFSLIAPLRSFPGSENYWKKRYRSGGNSGAGSYDKLSHFKAEILNRFVNDNNIKTVIEYGCGDGNQLKLLKLPKYLGFDISSEAISLCTNIFKDDQAKTFKLLDGKTNYAAELTLSLDVIYHLVEDDVFLSYMERLFKTSEKFVIIYSSNTDQQATLQANHVRHRMFTQWTAERAGWKLKKHIPNKYPYNGDDEEGSFADFFIFEKSDLPATQIPDTLAGIIVNN